MSKETKVTFSADGTGAEGATVGVVVIGEKPYAEGNGDRTDLALDQADRDAIANVKKAGIPVVVVLFGTPDDSGRRSSTRPMRSWPPGCRAPKGRA